MKTLSRILSLIVSFQLMVGCNQVSTSSGTIKTKAPGSSDSITISGSIASTIHHLTNLIMSNAMAADGTLILYNISNTNADPVEIDRWEISGETYSIKAKKSLAQDKILKLSFESNDPDKNRVILIDATGSVNSIEAPINPEEYFKSKIFESQLKSEFSGFTGNIKEIKARFSAMKGESFDSELALLGSNNEMLNMINSGNSDSILKMAELIHQRRLVKDDADKTNIFDSELLDIGKKLGIIDQAGTIDETAVIKDNQAILQCSGNEGSFIFNDDQLFNVFATSEDADFINQYQGASYFGSVKTSDQAQESIKTLISNLTELSKANSRNISARINFVGFDGKELTFNSCQLYGLPMSAEELNSIKDSSSGVIFDESFLKSAPLERFANYEEGARYLDRMYNKTSDSFKNLLAGVEDINNALWENQLPLIKALNESRRAQLKEFLASPEVSTLDMEQLSTGDVKDFEAAKASLLTLYKISLETLTNKIVESGFDIEQGRKILGEQTLVANTVYERRVREFFEKFQPFKQTEYGLDLSPVQALSFEGVDYPYGLAKDTLEKSAQRYYQELMNQKVDEGIVKAVIEEQRNYGYIYINLRIDEYACYRRMQELLGSSISQAAAPAAESEKSAFSLSDPVP